MALVPISNDTLKLRASGFGSRLTDIVGLLKKRDTHSALGQRDRLTRRAMAVLFVAKAASEIQIGWIINLGITLVQKSVYCSVQKLLFQ